jgi:uncharacterized membrane protein
MSRLLNPHTSPATAYTSKSKITTSPKFDHKLEKKLATNTQENCKKIARKSQENRKKIARKSQENRKKKYLQQILKKIAINITQQCNKCRN